MVEDWGEIKETYREHVERFPEERSNDIVIDDQPTNYPLLDSVKQDMSVVISGPNFVGFDENYLLTIREDFPDIPELEPMRQSEFAVELLNSIKIGITDDHLRYWEWSYKVFKNLEGDAI